jgi:hypothetical protein
VAPDNPCFDLAYQRLGYGKIFGYGRMETQKYMGVERRERARGVRFDKTINLGHILTFLGFLATIMVTWSTLDKRVVVLEESRKAQAIMDSAQDLRSAEKFNEIKETLGEIKRSVDRVNDRLERKP